MVTGLKKVSFSFQSQRRAVQKCSNYHTPELILHASKVILKIFQARLQQYVNQELPDVQLDFEEAEKPDIKLPSFTGHG